ncbi:MAG: exo-alpha-sialidase, partial [Bacteroidales bacterium]|nr:exo-alpha-sialidase [Bacteroidales bacterium]
LTAPYTGEVSFKATCDRELIIKIEGTEILHVGSGFLKNEKKIQLIKDEKYHISVIYLQAYGGLSNYDVTWSWNGQERETVDPGALSYTSEMAEWWNIVLYPDPATFDFSALLRVPVEHGFAYQEEGRFTGWPANNGAWSWGNEILVGFVLGYHKTNISGGHAINDDLPSFDAHARSLDGGLTWALETTQKFSSGTYRVPPGIPFDHPDFAMRVINERYYVSNDRGKSFYGPIKLHISAPGVKLGNMTSRTDYIVLGPQECLVFLSTETGLVESNYQDRVFCVKTTDGGNIFKFMGWLTADTDKRSVMPSTIRIAENHLVSVMRRKHEETYEERPSIVRNWIEAAESFDNGVTWTNLGKVAATDLGERNGNPPAMVKLEDGRLVVAYGYRDFPQGIRMKVSKDNGHSWGDEIILRSDGAYWDLGYPRMKVNEDGKIVVMYYYTSQQHFAQHIGVTIVNPEDLDNPQTGIGNQEKISGSGGILLLQNYPNPFTTSSLIGFEITEHHPDRTQLKIYDISGKEIMTLVDEQLPPGAYSMEINAADIPAGVYFFRLTHG